MNNIDPQKTSPVEYITYLQDFYARLNGVPIEEGRLAVQDQVVDDVVRVYQKELSELLPREINLPKYVKEMLVNEGKLGLTGSESFLGEAIQDAFKLMSAADNERFGKTPIGLVPHKLFNAHSIRVPSGGNVIVVNTAIIGGLPIINRYILSAFILRNRLYDNDIDGFIHDVSGFVLLLRRIVLYGQNALQSEGQSPDDSLDTLVKAIEYTFAQRLFILLHEIGHVVLGHLNDSNLQSQHPSDDEVNSIKYYLKSQNQEFEADSWAAQQMQNLESIHSKVNKVHVCMGLPFLFLVFHVLETVLTNELADKRTHPPARERLHRISSDLFDGSEKEAKAASALEGLISAIDLIKANI